MSWDNDNDDNDDFNFDFDDLSPEEKEEIEREMEETSKRIYSHPLLKKAESIYETVSALIESFPDEEREMHSGLLLESAMILAPKIVGAMGTGSWLLSMQNAALVRYHAEHLLISTSDFSDFFKADKDYVKLLRTEMIEFKELFRKWVKEINQLEREDFFDDWGLFNRE